MSPKLTEDQKHAIQEHGGAPIYLVDETTSAGYVLMSAEQFKNMKSLSEADDVVSMYPLIAEITPDDWEDASNYEKRP
jgi:hypothetical protein